MAVQNATDTAELCLCWFCALAVRDHNIHWHKPAVLRQVPSHTLCLYNGKRFKHASRMLSGYCAAASVDVAEVQGPVTRFGNLSIELRTVGEHAKPCADSLRV